MFGTSYTGGMTYRSASEINSAMGRVYGHMSLAVIVSMFVSYFVGSSPELLAFFFTGVLKWIVIFAPLVRQSFWFTRRASPSDTIRAESPPGPSVIDVSV